MFPIVQKALSQLPPASGKGSPRFVLEENGTAAGFRDFCAGRLVIANASRPINAAELEACRRQGVVFSELPLAFDAITVAVPSGNTWLRSLSLPQLRTLWSRAAQGRVSRWNQVNPAWPNRPIRLCGPGKDSGTFAYFNQAVNGSPTNSRTDYTASEDDNVLVKCVASNPDALGYFGFSYYASNRSRLRAVPIQNTRAPVAPSVASVQDGSYVPLSRLLFVYVNDRQLRRQPEVQRLITTLLRQARPSLQRWGPFPFRGHLPTGGGQVLPPCARFGVFRRPSRGAHGDQALQKSLESVRRPEYR